MTDPIRPEDEAADAAAERALRLNARVEDEVLARREAADPAFAAEVEAWNERLGPLIDEVTPVPPPAGLWPRIEALIAPRAANDDAPARFWRRWAYGSTGLLAASLAAVGFLLVNRPVIERIVEVPAPASVEHVSVATLTGDGDMPIATITYDPTTGALHVAPTRQMAMDESIPALWLVNPDGSTTLVGAIDPVTPQTHSLPEPLRPTAAGATALAISLEPMGEPLAPQARGPVVAVGEVSDL